MITKKTYLPVLLLGGILVMSTAYAADDGGYYNDDALQAPDVTFYVGVQGSRANLHYLGAKQQNGFNVLVGGYFNDISIGNLDYGVELGFQRIDDSRNEHSRALTPYELSQFVSQTPISGSITFLDKKQLNSLSFGGRLEGKRFYFRFGGALYDYHISEKTTYYYQYTNSSASQTIPSISSTKSGVAPYIGFGVHIPLIKHLQLTAGYDLYYVQSHRMPDVNIGLQYTD